MPVNLTAPSDVELVIAPPDEPQVARKSAAYNRKYVATDWTGQTGNFRLNPNIFLPKIIWWPWWPVRVCVSGHVRKIHDGEAPCPVPYVKVEIFDVGREDCWGPYFVRWWDKLIYRPVIRVPEILRERIFEVPPPLPDPIGPVARLGAGVLESQHVAFGQASPGETVSFNPQPDPPRWLSQTSLQAMGDEASSHETISISSSAQTTVSPQAVQSMQVRSSNIATSLENLTLTSRIAPWLIFPRCFYSRRLVCTTYTDSSGFFRCCFNWPRFHFRNGRWRYDPRPDIIIRVTQVINGVETVIYMDPYSSTRWNTTNAHIDLNLDNEEIQCGGGGEHDPLPGSPVFFTRIGDDEVYLINQNNGLYEVPPLIVNLSISAVLNECGVIPGSSVPPLDFTAQVSQENGRLRSWSLVYLKGINPVYHSLGAGSSGTSNTGSPATINQVVSGAPLLVGLTTTCAFALRLSATAHIRDGRSFIYHAEQNKAIAIENCPPCSDD